MLFDINEKNNTKKDFLANNNACLPFYLSANMNILYSLNKHLIILFSSWHMKTCNWWVYKCSKQVHYILKACSTRVNVRHQQDIDTCDSIQSQNRFYFYKLLPIFRFCAPCPRQCQFQRPRLIGLHILIQLSITYIKRSYNKLRQKTLTNCAAWLLICN
jgi:hypothetical protein